MLLFEVPLTVDAGLCIISIHEQKEILTHIAAALSEVAERLDIPFQFNPIVSFLDSLDVENLRVKTGEALAASSILQLHLMLSTKTIGRQGQRRRLPRALASPTSTESSTCDKAPRMRKEHDGCRCGRFRICGESRRERDIVCAVKPRLSKSRS